MHVRIKDANGVDIFLMDETLALIVTQIIAP